MTLGEFFGLFNELWHGLHDLWVLGGWFYDNLRIIFTELLLPVRFVYVFLKSFLDNAFSSPTTTTIWVFPVSVKEVFGAIPYWNVFSIVVGLAFTIFGAVAILKALRHL